MDAPSPWPFWPVRNPQIRTRHWRWISPYSIETVRVKSKVETLVRLSETKETFYRFQHTYVRGDTRRYGLSLSTPPVVSKGSVPDKSVDDRVFDLELQDSYGVGTRNSENHLNSRMNLYTRNDSRESLHPQESETPGAPSVMYGKDPEPKDSPGTQWGRTQLTGKEIRNTCSR